MEDHSHSLTLELAKVTFYQIELWNLRNTNNYIQLYDFKVFLIIDFLDSFLNRNFFNLYKCYIYL